ncbi:hypothetical protein [Rhizobium laguerreae]|uniref:hypothetical protein n=1 Tax=Rhizobium laguerreae TaxID=1076926 RepID=UPI001C929A2C|nr:hypothetical protein [Rhizobium laguerreae]MBY3386309.1 hypothetical protein [Rhizobium laguerreae]MBY3400392.1 hypothetical protein [Rhizobium laguerreae]MBY3407329.1 hypothetical protein [Rhizobium laguerreae]
MVTGEWGVGKTYQVRRALDEDEFHYISLYGLRTAEELRSAVFARMYPMRHRIRGFVGEAKQALRDASGLFSFGSLTPALFGAFLEQGVTNNRILVFDDLERSLMPRKILLGVINHYVEHSGCRVIVIVHDGKILDSYFNDSKEKLFGQTIQAFPQIDHAIRAFRKPFEGTKFGEFIAPFLDDILKMFASSGARSLRILKYAIEDLRRFYEVIDEKYRDNAEAMAECVGMLTVFAFEIRNGTLEQDDLRDRIRSKRGEGESALALVSERYQVVDLASPTLQDDLLVQMFIQGVFDSDAIRNSLEQSRHFLVPEETPPWRTVIEFDNLDDVTVQTAVDEMNRQIEELEPLRVGEMLHILALRLMMAEQGISGKTREQSVAEANAYIDAMFEKDQIPPRPLSYDWRLERYSSHDGTIFWVSDDMRPHFDRIVSHLRHAQEAALDKWLIGQVPAVIELLLDGKEFFEKFVQTYKGNNTFAHVAVLDKIPPEQFVAAFLNAPKRGWYWIGNTVDQRYKSSFQMKDLEPERPWAVEVVKLLKEEAAKLEGLARFRLLRALPKAVGQEEPEIKTVAAIDYDAPEGGMEGR